MSQRTWIRTGAGSLSSGRNKKHIYPSFPSQISGASKPNGVWGSNRGGMLPLSSSVVFCLSRHEVPGSSPEAESGTHNAQGTVVSVAWQAGKDAASQLSPAGIPAVREDLFAPHFCHFVCSLIRPLNDMFYAYVMCC